MQGWFEIFAVFSSAESDVLVHCIDVSIGADNNLLYRRLWRNPQSTGTHGYHGMSNNLLYT